MRQSLMRGKSFSTEKAKDKLMNVQQIMKRLQCGRSTVYNLINSGKLKGFTVLGTRGMRVRESVVEEYILEREANFDAIP